LFWGNALEILHHFVEDKRIIGTDNSYYPSFGFRDPWMQGKYTVPPSIEKFTDITHR